MKLETYLQSQSLSQPEFARRLNVSQSAVNMWLHGRRFPKQEMLLRISAATGGAVTPNDFLPEVVSSPPPSEDCPGA